MQKKIEEVLDLYVRPKLMEHEGGMEIVEYRDGILRVRLLGRCSGCPSAMLTTEELIKAEVMAHVSEVQDVVLVTAVSDELIDMAKKILNHEAVE